MPFFLQQTSLSRLLPQSHQPPYQTAACQLYQVKFKPFTLLSLATLLQSGAVTPLLHLAAVGLRPVAVVIGELKSPGFPIYFYRMLLWFFFFSLKLHRTKIIHWYCLLVVYWEKKENELNKRLTVDHFTYYLGISIYSSIFLLSLQFVQPVALEH